MSDSNGVMPNGEVTMPGLDADLESKMESFHRSDAERTSMMRVRKSLVGSADQDRATIGVHQNL